MSSGVEKRDIKGLIDSVTNIICIYVFNKHCDMDFLHRNILRYGFSGRYSPLVFTIYGHGGHLGHVTWIIYIYIGNPGIFFGCLRGRNKAPFPMRFRRIFSQFVEKNSQSQLKIIFNSSIPCEI